MNQLPEIIIIDDFLYTLYTTPLLPWLRAQDPTPVFDRRTPSCERGYIGCWKIEDELLWLTGLHGWRDGHFTRVSDLFDGQREVTALWFTGPLVVEPAASAINEGARPRPKTLVVKEGRVIQPEPLH